MDVPLMTLQGQAKPQMSTVQRCHKPAQVAASRRVHSAKAVPTAADCLLVSRWYLFGTETNLHSPFLGLQRRSKFSGPHLFGSKT